MLKCSSKDVLGPSNVSLWNQYKHIAFNIFSCRILMFIITGLSNEKTNKLTIYAILCQNVTIFYRQKQDLWFRMQEKLKVCRNPKWNYPSSRFIANDNYVKIVWLHVVVFNEHDILHSRDNVHLLKYYPVKVSQHCFYSFNSSNQTGMQVSKLSFEVDK